MASHEQSSWLGIKGLNPTYMWVWVGLLILTVVEVLVPDPHMLHVWGLVSTATADWIAGYMPRTFVVVSLILLALTKTFFVAWYYMHLIDERPSIILIACAPFIFSVFLTIGLWPHLPANSAIKGEPGKANNSGAQSQVDFTFDSQRRADAEVADGMQLADEALSQR